MSLRVGTINFATEQGLGILAKSFYDAGVVTDFMMVRHGSYGNHEEWYPGAKIISGRDWTAERRTVLQFCELMDVVLFFETPFYWNIIPALRGTKTKTALMPMYECMPANLPFHPDIIINPSALDQKYYPQGTFIPIPVEVPWRGRQRCETFVHNAGHGGLNSRNGTGELLDAWKLVKSPAKLLIRSQKRFQWDTRHDSRIEVRVGSPTWEELWRDGGYGDCFIFPEKFNGLSLPLQEARAAGMLVMATDRFPMNEWLPTEPLFKTAGFRKETIGRGTNEYECAIIDPGEVAKKVDEFYGEDISAYSEAGKKWAETMSWDALRPKYLEALSK